MVVSSLQPAFDFDLRPPYVAESATPYPHVLSTLPAPEANKTPNVSFPAALLGLYSLQGLGRKGLLVLEDLPGGLVRIWDNDVSVTMKALQTAHIPDAERIATDIHARRDDLIEVGVKAAEALQTQQDTTVLSWKELPSRYKSIPGGPKWLFVQGSTQSLTSAIVVALVGTRKPSPEGIRAVFDLAELLSAYPITMISGLADGIDAAAHEATLNRKMPNIALLGHGINIEFPATTVAFRRRIIAEGGAVATEYMPTERYQKQYFVQRNRLQAALADIVIPVEGQLNGGTAHTVRFATQYQRRLVGVWWPGASGLVSELVRVGAHIINVTDSSSRRDFDILLRQLVEEGGLNSYPLANLEQAIAREFGQRSVRPEDIERLMSSIKSMKSE